jgi:hypothetical protein
MADRKPSKEGWFLNLQRSPKLDPKGGGFVYSQFHPERG